MAAGSDTPQLVGEEVLVVVVEVAMALARVTTTLPTMTHPKMRQMVTATSLQSYNRPWPR